MRHSKKRHKLGVTGPHRAALLANLSVALIEHGRIKTTLAKAKALRPFVEKVITLAKKAQNANEPERKLHFRRLAIERLRDKSAVSLLFDDRVIEFMDRPGGYTRIYKIGQRIGDAAEMGLIELIDANDEGYSKRSSKKVREKSGEKAEQDVTPVAGTEETLEAVEPAEEENSVSIANAPEVTEAPEATDSAETVAETEEENAVSTANDEATPEAVEKDDSAEATAETEKAEESATVESPEAKSDVDEVEDEEDTSPPKSS